RLPARRHCHRSVRRQRHHEDGRHATGPRSHPDRAEPRIRGIERTPERRRAARPCPGLRRMNGPDLMPVPHAIDAERSVIGAAMVSRDAWLKVSDWLLPEHFYNNVHGSIWRAICDLAAQDKPSDSVTV